MVEEQKLRIEELEDEVQIAEDQRLRLEVNWQAAKADYEKKLVEKEAEGEEKRKSLVKTVSWIYFLADLNNTSPQSVSVQIATLNEELENERRAKNQNANGRKKLEAQVLDLEAQLDLSNRLKEDYGKQLKKLNVSG